MIRPGTLPPVKRTALGRMAHETPRSRSRPMAASFTTWVTMPKSSTSTNSSARVHTCRAAAARQTRTPRTKGRFMRGAFRCRRHRRVDRAPARQERWPDAGRRPSSQAEVPIDARTAADIVGATHMDRPDGPPCTRYQRKCIACSRITRPCGRGAPSGARSLLGPDAANPRGPNLMGHIILLREAGTDPAATRFTWDIFVQAGDPHHGEPLKRGTTKVPFAQPDGLYVDRRGVLWIQTRLDCAQHDD